MTVTVYGTAASGNCHKVKMVLEITGQPYVWHEVDVTRGETRTPAFLQLNANGKVPVVVLPDGSALAESNAILWYFGEGTALVPADRLQRARMLQWMFFEQYTHEPAIAVARYLVQFLGQPQHERLPALHERGHAALAVMERHLAAEPYFAGPQISLADLALYAYTHKAHDGGFDLGAYPAVRAWLERCRAQRGVSEMPAPNPSKH
jgi:glutathione S-transferase